MTPTTTLPTEVGTYLFSGSREGRLSAHELCYHLGVEIVRVRHDANGKLCYIGLDVFYRPSQAVGAWLPIAEQCAVLLEAARTEMLGRTAREVVPKVFKDVWGGHMTEDALVRAIAYPFVRDDDLDVARRVFEKSVELKLIEPETKPGYEGWWCLAGVPR